MLCIVGSMVEDTSHVFWENMESTYAFGETPCTPGVFSEQTDTEVILRIELPGVAQEDVKTSLHERELEVNGWLGVTRQTRETLSFCSSVLSFYRRIPLPKGLDILRARASFAQGLLTVHVPFIRASARMLPVRRAHDA